MGDKRPQSKHASKIRGLVSEIHGHASEMPPNTEGLHGARRNLFAGGGSRLWFVKTQHRGVQDGEAPLAEAGLHRDFVCGDVTMRWAARAGPDGWENQPVAPGTRHRPPATGPAAGCGESLVPALLETPDVSGITDALTVGQSGPHGRCGAGT